MSILHSPRIEIAQSFAAFVILLGLFIALSSIMDAGNRSSADIAKERGYDMSATTQVLVDHPDGTLSVQEVPMWRENDQPMTEKESTKVVWVAFGILGFFAWCAIYG